MVDTITIETQVVDYYEATIRVVNFAGVEYWIPKEKIESFEGKDIDHATSITIPKSMAEEYGLWHDV